MKVNIDGWKTHICFSSAHIIPGHGKCGCLHGHTYAIHVVIKGELDDTGILVDFGELKKTLKKISEKLDHRLLVPHRLVKEQDTCQVTITTRAKTYILPLEDCCFLPIDVITAEKLAQYILEQLFHYFNFPSHVRSVSVGVDEGMGQGAWAHQGDK